jgi:DNA-binding IscR family transcriptional regulator
VTYIELANMLGLSESGIYKSMSKLRADGKIKRVEGKNGGHWEIIE